MAFKGHKTGWSAVGTLTTRTDANPNPDGAVHLQVDFGEKNSEYYTLQFSILPPPFVGEESIGIKGKAELLWTVEGNFIRRVVSVSNGQSISGLGQAVSIKITDDSFNPNDNPAVQYGVSVQVTRGTRPAYGNSQPPLFSVMEGIYQAQIGPPNPDAPVTVAAGSDLAIAVPPDCGINCFLLMIKVDGVAGIDDESVRVEQTSAGIIMAETSLRMANDWQPLMPGATTIVITNSSASDIIVTPLFGVEG